MTADGTPGDSEPTAANGGTEPAADSAGEPAPEVDAEPPAGDGYQTKSSTAVVDSPRQKLAFLGVLAAAAAVDVVNFQLVIAVVMNESAIWLTWVVVGGFTVLALALSHQIGSGARGRVDAKRLALTSGVGWLALLGWLAMGLFAFAIRYRGPQGTTAAQRFLGGQGDPLQASLFLTLYIATGLLTAFFAYERAHPEAVRYRNAQRKRRRVRDTQDKVRGQIKAVSEALDQARKRDAQRATLIKARLRLAIAFRPPPPDGAGGNGHNGAHASRSSEAGPTSSGEPTPPAGRTPGPRPSADNLTPEDRRRRGDDPRERDAN